VRNGLDPKRYTVSTTPALLKKTSAWEDYDDGARPLQDAIRKLTAPASARRSSSKSREKSAQVAKNA
jgi:bifunctional non-homologous end joining protein LigD